MNWEKRLKKQAEEMLLKRFEEIEKAKKRRQKDLAYYIEEIKLVKNAYSKNLLSCHPNRDTVISLDEITNLKIALGSSKSVDDFLKMGV